MVRFGYRGSESSIKKAASLLVGPMVARRHIVLSWRLKASMWAMTFGLMFLVYSGGQSEG
jgi:hypothetical protein